MLPDLTRYDVISIDTETYDPNLMKRGPGWATGDGKLLGLSFSAPDGTSGFIATDHWAQGFPLSVIRHWAKTNLTTKAVKVGANIMYDIGWLRASGIEVSGPFFDVQYADCILDENQKSYSLDNIAKRMNMGGKLSDELYDYCAREFGGKPDGKQRANIHRCPLELVRPYAIRDADLPLKIRAQQIIELEKQGLSHVADLEHGNIDFLIAMKLRGALIDQSALAKVRSYMDDHLVCANKVLADAAGRQVNVNAPQDIAKLFDAHGLHYDVTPKGNPSFTKQCLVNNDDPLSKAIVDVRRFAKMKSTFIDGYMGYIAADGRIHCELHPLRSDEYGTVSGRFSSSNPNLQNIPSRDPELGPLIRGLFIPDDGCTWVKADYSQVEYRVMLHYATGKEAEAARECYRSDPSMDYHQMVADMCGVSRTAAKTINFGLLYGMGRESLRSLLNVGMDEADSLVALYHDRAPFIKALSSRTTRIAALHGSVASMSGRLHRFNRWESSSFNSGTGKLYGSKEEALAGERGSVKRAKTHTALNRKIQGSAADVLKYAMRDLWVSGVLDCVGVPMLTVHDELDFALPTTDAAREGMREVKNIMETCVELTVPLRVDVTEGPNWGKAK